MARRLKGKINASIALIYLPVALAAFFLFPDASYSADYGDEPEIITTVTERVIKVEGTLDKPRVLFIVPKAKLWKPEFDRADFHEKLLHPPYPEALVPPEKDGSTIY